MAAAEANRPPDPLEHLELIDEVARRYRRCGLELADLKQEGWFGLNGACDEFDPSRGKFDTFAARRIRYAILDAINDQVRPIRVPRWARKQIRKGITPDTPSLRRKRRESLRAAAIVLAADRLAPELMPLIPRPECESIDPRFAVDVEPRLADLTPREAAALRLRFGLDGGPPLTHAGIGERLGLSPSSVPAVVRRALAKLRRAMGETGTDRG